jgi:glycosyltransferase involved in cell wall biosynthesis
MSLPDASPPLSIIHVLRAPVGGLFRHVCDLAREQAARGCKVGVIADSLTGASRADDIFTELSAVLSLGVHRVAMPRNPGLRDVFNIVAIARKLSDLAPDVVHGHGSKGGLYARAAGLMARKGPVRAYTPHGGSFHYAGLQGALYMGTERLLARATDLFLFESAFIRGRFDRAVTAPDERKRVTLNGVSETEFEPVIAHNDATDFLYIGELRALKGVDTLLDAMAMLRGAGAPTLSLVGSGAEEAALRIRVETLGLGERVRFLGMMPAREAFARGRILVVPSRAESLPYVVIEGAAARVPIIATDVGGIPEILAPVAGELIAPDDPMALAAAMRSMHALPPDDIAARTQAIAAFVRERFTISAMTTSIMQACHEARASRAGLPQRVGDSNT